MLIDIGRTCCGPRGRYAKVLEKMEGLNFDLLVLFKCYDMYFVFDILDGFAFIIDLL